jgi:hypothetical protein
LKNGAETAEGSFSVLILELKGVQLVLIIGEIKAIAMFAGKNPWFPWQGAFPSRYLLRKGNQQSRNGYMASLE